MSGEETEKNINDRTEACQKCTRDKWRTNNENAKHDKKKKKKKNEVLPRFELGLPEYLSNQNPE